MSVTKEDVAKAARLARIKLSQEELTRFTPVLSGILGWIEQLGEVNTDNVAPLANVVDIELHLREDEKTDGGDSETVLANAPQVASGYFVVPKVVE